MRLSGADVFLRDISGSNWAACITESYSFDSTVGITFRFLNDEHKAGYTALFRTVCYFLTHDGDFLLLCTFRQNLSSRHQFHQAFA